MPWPGWDSDGPWTRRRLDNHPVTIEILTGIDEDPFALALDVFVRLDSGACYTGEFVTMEALAEYLQKPDLGGCYWTSNAVVIADATPGAVIRAVEHLLAAKELEQALLPVPPDL